MVTSYNIKEEHMLSDEWGKLQKDIFETKSTDGRHHEHRAELYDPGNGAAVLLYNADKGTVLLIRQFRLATVKKGNPSGLLVEACAGKTDDLSPDETIIKEIWEETGYAVTHAEHVMSVYPSPGSFTERLELFVAAYSPEQKKGDGGGLKDEGEDIDVIEIPFKDALSMIWNGEIQDGKTIILLQYAALKGLVK
jgi:nudix-type nucleoside diphosphatase (YffH/AdpP family)